MSHRIRQFVAIIKRMRGYAPLRPAALAAPARSALRAVVLWAARVEPIRKVAKRLARRRWARRLLRGLEAWAQSGAAPGPAIFREAIAGAEKARGFVRGRVILVCGNLAPGGTQRQVVNTLLEFARYDLESVRLLCNRLAPGHPEKYDFFLPNLEEAGVEVREIRARRASWFSPKRTIPKALARHSAALPPGLVHDINNLYWEFRRLKPEVVHAWLDWSNVRAGIAAAMAGVPRIVLSCRNINPSHFQLYRSYMDPAYEALAELPNVVLINNSRAGAIDYARWLKLPESLFRVVYNGVHLENHRRASADEIDAFRAQLGIRPGVAVIGSMLRLSTEKRPLLWIESAAAIAASCPNVGFVMFGDGPMRGEVLDRARELGIADSLVLRGVTKETDLALSSMDVLLLTSYGEGTPNVALEAQWVGTPVVASEAGGMGEAVESGVTGWIVEQPDPEAIAERVVALLADPALRARARKAGPAFVSRRFGLSRMVRECIAAYGYSSEDIANHEDYNSIGAVAVRHASELREGKRFNFGKNWRRFLSVLNDERIAEAEKSLCEFLEMERLDGKTFVDVGSGSGLFSLAARRLGARVRSFDYDPQSVACTEELKRRYFPNDDSWTIEAGSVLDREYVESLGKFDIVYAWGVLHHTGDMWRALELVKILVKRDGRLFIAIYNDAGKFSSTWLKIKRLYCVLPASLGLPFAIGIWTPIEVYIFIRYCRVGKPGAYFDLYRDYKKSRGMSRWHDMIDWIGGYPYEFAKAEDLVAFYTKDGFRVMKMLENKGYGNHQIVFAKNA